MKPIETAGVLYREIKRRGLHLREQNGRDDALLQELTSRLGCPDEHLQRFLDASNLSAEAFLRVFLQLAAPFARMFQEIWEYLSHHNAPKTAETISIRFGFEDDEDRQSFDLEQFRRYVETSRMVFASVVTHHWPSEALNGLFSIGRTVISPEREPIWRIYNEHGRYEPGKPYDLPLVSCTGHPFDEVVQGVRDVFQQIIIGYIIEMEQEHSVRRLPEVIEQKDQSEHDFSFQRSSSLLTDLLPTWYYIFARCANIGERPKDAALQEYDVTVRPLLQSRTDRANVPLLEALDILDLPFWRHRWHTYEVWASVLTLRSLQEYRPILRIGSGHIPLDGYTAAVVADLKAHDCVSACVAVQVETPFRKGKRKAIKPDLRVCFADPSSAENTAGVIEFKQRSRIDRQVLAEMANAYSHGCPRSGGVLILNYDSTSTAIYLPPNCYFIEGVQPLNLRGIRLFQQRLSEILCVVGFEPPRGSTIVLLDVSASMGDSYRDRNVQVSLRKILGMPWVKILRFNNWLVEGGDLDPLSAQSLTTSGGTQLGRALSDLEYLFGLPDNLLIVTDGGHEHPTDLLKRIPRVKECAPAEIGDNIAWLT